MLSESYVRRLALYAAFAVSASIAGSTFTWSSSAWQNASPFVDGPRAALFALMVSIPILAIARFGVVGCAVCSALVGISMLVMWSRFATNDSSTSGLVFLLGTFVGVPVAAAIVAAASLRDRTSIVGNDDV